MADTQMGEDGVGREESGGEESSAPWLSQLPLGETRIFYRLQALKYVHADSNLRTYELSDAACHEYAARCYLLGARALAHVSSCSC